MISVIALTKEFIKRYNPIMKKALLLILSFLFVLTSQAGSFDKEYKKLIEKFDVADSAKSVSPNSPVAFWNAVLDGNESLIRFGIDMKKNEGAEKEALKKTAQLPRFYPQYDESIIENMQGFCDTLLIKMGIADLPIKCSLHVIYSEEVNAYMVLTEDGFAMCLTSALLMRKGVTDDILMGYVAHEFVHGALLHHIRSFYSSAKERRKNEVLAGIAAGLNGMAAGANAYAAGMSGQYYDNTPYYEAIANLDNVVKESTLMHSFAFSREQEYEADLIAFRFMENMLGSGEEFINGLRILGSANDQPYDEDSDHPTMTSRIDFLKFVQQNPSLRNKVNKKLKKKRTSSEFEW